MTEKMELAVGQRVIVHSGPPDHGTFTGTITSVNGVTAIIQPEDPALRLWYPHGYDVGSALWRQTIQPYPEGAES